MTTIDIANIIRRTAAHHERRTRVVRYKILFDRVRAGDAVPDEASLADVLGAAAVVFSRSCPSQLDDVVPEIMLYAAGHPNPASYTAEEFREIRHARGYETSESESDADY